MVQSILIIGGDGVIGQALASRLIAEGYRVSTTTRRPSNSRPNSVYLDLYNKTTFENILSGKFDIFIMCAGNTSISECEKHPEETKIINVEAVIEIATLLCHESSFFIYLSTSLVFNGATPLPKISDNTNPSTEYGRQKAEVEKLLLSINTNLSVIRLSKVIQPTFPLFLGWHKDLSDNREIQPFKNSYISPISLNFAIVVIMYIIRYHKTGIVHVSADRDISYEDVARHLANACGLPNGLINPHVRSMHRQGPCLYATLDTESLRAIGFKSPSPYEALDDLLKFVLIQPYCR